MERTPHVMLVGDGAARFAREIGERRGRMLTAEARGLREVGLRKNSWRGCALTAYNRCAGRRWCGSRQRPVAAGAGAPGGRPRGRSRGTHGTVDFLVRARDGRIAGGISTSGWAYKYPGQTEATPG